LNGGDFLNLGENGEVLGIDLFVQVGRLLGRFSFAAAAEAIGIPEPRLRDFYNRAILAGWNRRPEFAEKMRRQEEAGENWILARHGEKPRFRFINLETIRAGLERNDEAWAIANRHGLDYCDFAHWLNQHQDELRKEQNEKSKRR